MNYFITAISTDSGKSVVSALLTYALGYAYWKPVQAGEPTDTDFVEQLLPNATIFDEKYKLNTACSPHEAARIDGVKINSSDFIAPKNENLIIEGAGGVLVPINNKGETILDLIDELQTECIVVSNHYLGSINHTLLTIQALQNRGIKIKGIVFNGNENKATEEVILKNTSVPFLFRVDQEKQIDQTFLEKYSPIVQKAFL
jgi:dethiobiotin synthetase